MANIVWPSSLPQRPTVGGYQERFADTVLRTAMETGAAKTRRRFTAAPRQVEVTFRVNAAQAAIFKSFFEETTAGGALPFDWVHPRHSRTKPRTFPKPPWRPVMTLARDAFSPMIRMTSSSTSMPEMTERR